MRDVLLAAAVILAIAAAFAAIILVPDGKAAPYTDPAVEAGRIERAMAQETMAFTSSAMAMPAVAIQ